MGVGGVIRGLYVRHKSCTSGGIQAKNNLGLPGLGNPNHACYHFQPHRNRFGQDDTVDNNITNSSLFLSQAPQQGCQFAAVNCSATCRVVRPEPSVLLMSTYRGL